MQWEIHALYESVSRKKSATAIGLLEVVASMIKALSSTLFSLNKVEVSNYITRLGGSGPCSATVLYWYYNMFWTCINLQISKWTKRTSKCFKITCIDGDFFIDLDKTKVMLFNTTQAWVTRSKQEFFLGEEKVAYTQSYKYQWVTFIGSYFSWEGLHVLDFLIYISTLRPRETMWTNTVPRATNKSMVVHRNPNTDSSPYKETWDHALNRHVTRKLWRNFLSWCMNDMYGAHHQCPVT